MEEKTHFDESLFEDLFTPGKDESIQNFKSFVKLFHDSWLSNAIKLDEAAAKSDFETIQIIGHTLKGSAANMGARTMMEISAAIEAHAKAGQIKEIVALSGKLKNECEHVEYSLEDYGQRLARAAK